MIWALHGNLGEPADWAATVRFLQPFPVSMPCLWESPPLEFRTWARAFVAAVEERKEERRVLMGYSLGARLAMHVLLEGPGFWDAAIFISGHPGLTDQEERECRRRNDHEWAQRLRSGTISEFAKVWNAQAVFGGEGPSCRQLEVLTQHREAIATAFDCWSLGRQESFGDRLRACPVPQLWVAGARDAKFATLARTMASGAERASAVILNDCGHRVPLQKPRELAECVRPFLKACNLEVKNVETSC
jgi:2-succinyl-6-hydroxy-2,4-cyclohexadiene-1-carboxylate synthase